MFKKFNILTYHNQRQYLDDKFQIGERTQNPIPTWFPKDMRYMTTETGQQHFTVDKFLCAQQIQRYFSCNAAKLRHTTAFQSGEKVTKAIYRWLGTKNHIHMPVLLS